MQSFTYVNCNVLLGIDESNSELFGIWVTYENVVGTIFTPTVGFPHKIIKGFSALVPRKTLFGLLITTLRDANIVPVNGFDHPKNPDNQYYIEIPCDKMKAAIDIIRMRISGVASLDREKEVPTPIISESTLEMNLPQGKKEYDESETPSCTTLTKKNAPLLEIWNL